MNSLLGTVTTAKEPLVDSHLSRICPYAICYSSHPEHELLGSLVLDNTPQCVPLARRFVTVVLRAAGFESFTESFALLASELVTNAHVHTRDRSGALVHICVFTDGAVLRLEVHDPERTFPVPRPVTPDDESGRGLHLVEAIASRWGVQSNRNDKNVWCELDLEPPSAPRSDPAGMLDHQGSADHERPE